MKRRVLLLVPLVVLLFAVPGGEPSAGAQEQVSIRLATIAPRGSAWMRGFGQWNQRLQRETNGRLRLQIYPGGAAGDERTVVRKLRAGQLDAAAMTTTGLGLIARQVLVLQAPGVIESYEQLDAVRSALAPELEQQFQDNGFVLLGWGDAGQTRLFSKHRIDRPSQLRQVRPWVWRDSPVFVEYLRAAGANGVPLALPEVLAGLSTDRIDTVPGSALAAVSLQWFTQVRYVSEQASGVVVGALVLRKETFDSLDETSQRALLETSRDNSGQLARAIRGADQRAYRALVQRGLTPVNAGAHRDEWVAVARRARENLTGRLYSRDLLERVQRIAEQAR